MSKRRKVFSGVFVVSILAKHFGFAVVSQRGSHVKLRHSDGRTTVIPLHKELAQGTLSSILDLAGLDRKQFLDSLGK